MLKRIHVTPTNCREQAVHASKAERRGHPDAESAQGPLGRVAEPLGGEVDCGLSERGIATCALLLAVSACQRAGFVAHCMSVAAPFRLADGIRARA